MGKLIIFLYELDPLTIFLLGLCVASLAVMVYIAWIINALPPLIDMFTGL